MLRVGVTGGLCTGKGLVTGIFSELGAAVLDADEVAHGILDSDEAVRRGVIEEFGPEVVGEDGRILRRELAKRVFRDRTKLERLNELVHPGVKVAIRKWLREREASDEKSVAVVNVPLLIEADMIDDFDAVVVVSASEENQILRCIKRDGLSRQEALDRIKSQLPLAEKEKHADYVVRNDSGREAITTKVKELWEKLNKRK